MLKRFGKAILQKVRWTTASNEAKELGRHQTTYFFMFILLKTFSLNPIANQIREETNQIWILVNHLYLQRPLALGNTGCRQPTMGNGLESESEHKGIF